MIINNIKLYLDLYNTEDYLFKVVGKNAKKRGYLTFNYFFQICMWKSSRQKPNYLKNKENVKSITQQAFEEKDEVKKMNILCSLYGVGIPTASAILTVVYPERYAIIDIRCVSMLRKLKFEIKKVMSMNNWIDYLSTMRELARENNVTPRQLDMILFSMHKESMQKDNYKNLYKN